jgi:hypothetical protein
MDERRVPAIKPTHPFELKMHRASLSAADALSSHNQRDITKRSINIASGEHQAACKVRGISSLFSEPTSKQNYQGSKEIKVFISQIGMKDELRYY